MKLGNILRHTSLDEALRVYCRANGHDVLLYSGTRDMIPTYYEDKTIARLESTCCDGLKFVIKCPPIVVPIIPSEDLPFNDLDDEDEPLPFY